MKGKVKGKRNTRISIETHRVLVISKPKRLAQSWCEACCEPVEMLTPEEAAAVARVDQRAIYRWIEAGHVHFTEAPEGTLLICLNSLSALLTTDSTICQRPLK